MSKESSDWKNKLYFGDNLPIMRKHIADESVDLIYLDPPFNSQATYNVLFAETNGANSSAQITAFEDTWHWGDEAEGSYREVVQQGGRLADLLQSLRRFLGENDMMAYLVMMAPRLKELHRVLKGTGSVYVHCDDTACHYLKLLMDSIYGANNYRNQVIWQRTNSHNTAKRYGRVYDVILFYTKTDNYCWKTLKTPYSEEQLKRYRKDEAGRLFTGQDLTASRPNSTSGKFQWRGTMPPQSRGWGYTIEQLEQWWAEGRILTRRDGSPRMDGLKVYLEDMTGKALQAVWMDIPRLPNTSSERLGYPTQKPEALLERIISASSNEGDLVLDPFCGCGTTVAVAERIKRRWIGIDITYLAISLMKTRLQDTFKGELSPYEIIGDPKDISGAKALAEQNRFQFEWWVVGKVGAYPAKDKRKGADSGIDGIINFFDDNSGFPKKIVVQVKSGKVQVSQIRDLIGVVKREEAVIGAFITLNPPTEPMKIEAVKEGYYVSELLGNDRKFPKIQIITVEDLLLGASIDYPRLGDATFKKAQRQFKKADKQSTIIK